MSAISQPPAGAVQANGWASLILVRELWASLAIAAMWIAVAVSAVWGPNFVSTSGAGSSSTTIPSGIAVALFASVGTWAVAKYAFGRAREER